MDIFPYRHFKSNQIKYVFLEHIYNVFNALGVANHFPA